LILPAFALVAVAQCAARVEWIVGAEVFVHGCGGAAMVVRAAFLAGGSIGAALR
jgi:hypothetical protein